VSYVHEKYHIYLIPYKKRVEHIIDIKHNQNIAS